jgi:hypothetical protein
MYFLNVVSSNFFPSKYGNFGPLFSKENLSILDTRFFWVAIMQNFALEKNTHHNQA